MPNGDSASQSEMRQSDPDNLTAAEMLKVITLALAQTRGADPLIRLKAEALMNEDFARGMQRGFKKGSSDGYHMGYREGREEGKREALDTRAMEEAERVAVKAAARARKESPGIKRITTPRNSGEAGAL